jgi:hypothetical protein
MRHFHSQGRLVLLFDLVLLGLLALLVAPTPLRADPTTYTYTGNLLDFEGVDPSLVCGPVCEITGMFTVAQPLSPNLDLATFTPPSFSFTDGLTTYNQVNTPPALELFYDFSTNSSGAISGWAIFLQMVVGPDSYTELSSTYSFPYGGVDAAQLYDPFLEAFALTYSPGTWESEPAAIPTPEPRSIVLFSSGLLIILVGTRRKTAARWLFFFRS